MYSDFLLVLKDTVNIFVFLYETAVAWFPIAVGVLFWNLWVRYKRAAWVAKLNWVLLEIKLPREILKSPLGMEVVLNALYQTSFGKWPDWYFKGRVRDWFSLEIASFEGSVKFFIRTPEVYKNVIEAQIYAQYPNIEIYEVPDYVRYINYFGKGSEWEIWGTEYKFDRPDAYPIKTYVDYGLNREGVEEEEKVDPLTATIEFMGSIGKDEQVWLQILVQATQTRFKDPKAKFFWQKRDWKDEGKDLIDEVMEKSQPKGEKFGRFLTTDEQDLIKALSRSIGKLGFDCGIRAIYLAKQDAFKISRIKSIIGLLRQYNSNELNSFKITNYTGFDYPWQDFFDIRVTVKKLKTFNAYKKRSYFYPPHKRKPIVLNSEELATLYHFPGGVAQTPTFGRIESRKAEPPTNLPLG